jgi:hypothetical protein
MADALRAAIHAGRRAAPCGSARVAVIAVGHFGDPWAASLLRFGSLRPLIGLEETDGVSIEGGGSRHTQNPDGLSLHDRFPT